MRRALGLLSIAACLSFGSSGGQAAPLSFSGSLSLSVLTDQSVTIPGAGVAIVNGSGGLGHLSTLALPASAFGPAGGSLPVTALATVQSVRFTNVSNLSGSFGPNLSAGPPGGGPQGLSGIARICANILPNCGSPLNIPLSPSGTVGFGIGGTQNLTGTFSVTLQHNPWTIGQPVLTIHQPTTTVTTPTLPGGFAHDASSATSSTAAPSGTVQLVTITKAYTDLTGSFPEFPMIAVLNLHFVPEPGALLLLGSAAAALALHARRRRRP